MVSIKECWGLQAAGSELLSSNASESLGLRWPKTGHADDPKHPPRLFLRNNLTRLQIQPQRLKTTSKVYFKPCFQRVFLNTFET